MDNLPCWNEHAVFKQPRVDFKNQVAYKDTNRYFRLIVSERRFNEVRHSPTNDGIGPAPPDKWMIIFYKNEWWY